MISASTDKSNARLSFCLCQRLRLHGQLQHACTLTYEEMREQHDLAIRELKSIMVRTRIVQVHLPKPSYLVTEALRFPPEKT